MKVVSIPAHAGCPSGVGGYRQSLKCTHGHSPVGCHSRSGWEDRSWWWSPEASNLSDNGRELCFQPAARMEEASITLYPATLPNSVPWPLISHVSTYNSASGCNEKLLCLIKPYWSFGQPVSYLFHKAYLVLWARSVFWSHNCGRQNQETRSDF